MIRLPLPKRRTNRLPRDPIMCGTAAQATSPPEKRISLKLTPDALDVRRTLEELRGRLTGDVSSDALARLEIVAAEILNNVVEHAFDAQANPGGQITLDVWPDAGRLTLKITDTGRAMPDGVMPAGRMPELDPNDPASLPEGGFGWGLIHEMSNELKYTRDGATNRLDLWIAL